MTTQAGDLREVTIATNRVDLYAQAWGLSVRQLIAYNPARFHARPWIWLRVGDLLRITPPPDGELLAVRTTADGDDMILLADGRAIAIEE